MRSKALLLSIALLSLIITSACNSVETQAKGAAPKTVDANAPGGQADDGVKRINIADAKADFEKGKAVMIDVRGDMAFKQGHIKGAQSIAFSEITERAADLPKDKTIILYCSCPAEHSSVAAGQALHKKGVDNTAALVGGYPAWKSAGYPVEEPAAN
ncbi:MAG TPA: rhodanese-like domain-containing protein [Pyrinomonadaceae bacterium]|jgi:rhodanese-related sulfurtransferase|nr:rhodanese-like domain-containing protein [Pyrinomonadaceae bacterium]